MWATLVLFQKLVLNMPRATQLLPADLAQYPSSNVSFGIFFTVNPYSYFRVLSLP